MIWEISFSEEANSFLRKNRNLREEDVIELIKRTLRMFAGERINVNVKKLKGEWSRFHRIRKGNIRVIAAFDFEHHSVLAERIDWRGGAYK